MVNYQKTQENLDKLRRNELQMTPEQKMQYKSNLRNFRVKIAEDCNLLMENLLFDGFYILDSDEDAKKGIESRVMTIVNNPEWTVKMKELKTILFQTYSLREFCDALTPLRLKLRYKAYGPYWASKTVTDQKTGQKKNLIIDAICGPGFYWRDERGQWENEKCTAARADLPPTMDLIKDEYEQEMKRYANKSRT